MSLFTLNLLLIVGAFAVFAIPAVIVALRTETDEADPREATAEAEAANAEAAEILSRMAAKQAVSSAGVEPYDVLERDMCPAEGGILDRRENPGTDAMTTLWGKTRSQHMEANYREAMANPRYHKKSYKLQAAYCRTVAARKTNNVWSKYAAQAVRPS